MGWASTLSVSGIESDVAFEARLKRLEADLRCLVCQNQTLADSNAELAVDLRNEVLRQMAAGRDDAQIKTRLVERYGEIGGVQMRNFLLPDRKLALAVYSNDRRTEFGEVWRGEGLSIDLIRAAACG